MDLCVCTSPELPSTKPRMTCAIWPAMADSVTDFLLLSRPSQKELSEHVASLPMTSASHVPENDESSLDVNRSQMGVPHRSLKRVVLSLSAVKPG